MESHQCKLCPRSFVNGRALGGHMKSHFATLQLGGRDSVSSSSSHQQNQHKTHHQKPGSQKTKTESRSPTRPRSKRNEQSQPSPSWTELSPEPESVSSISTASLEEHVAMCLVMLSMNRQTGKSAAEIETKSKKTRPRNRCEKCLKLFRSNRALNGHRKICSRIEEKEDNGGKWKIFKCPYCCKVFGSGQALGGHKRSHLLGFTRAAIDAGSLKLETGLDLNLPAPIEEDDYSVVSDA